MWAAAYAQQDFSAVSLPLDVRAPDIRFAGMSFRGDSLYLALSSPVEGASAEVSALLDSRTGESIPNDAGTSFGQREGTLQYYETRFPGITAEDLPYLQPQITYTFPLLLTPETLTFSFSTAPVAAYTHTLDLHLSGGTHVSRISVSPIGIQITGTCRATPDWQKPSISLLLQDGTTVSTNAYAIGITSPGSDPAASFDISYEYISGTYSRRFLPLSDIAAVTIEDRTITIAE